MAKHFMKKMLMIGLGAVAMGVGAFAGLSATKSFGETAAATGTSGDVIYFTPSTKWENDCDEFILQWFKNGSYIANTAMSVLSVSEGEMSSRTTYYGSPAADFDKVQILGYKSGSQKYYSGQSSVSGDMRWLVMTAGCDWNDTWVAGDGSGTLWSNVDIKMKRADQAPSSDTGRIFINNSGSHYNPVAIRAWGGHASPTIGGAAADATIYHPTWIQDDDAHSTYYGYCDIPTDVTGFKIVKVSAEDSYDATVNYYCSNDAFTMSSGTSRGVFYCPADGDNVSIGGAKDDEAGSVLMGAICAAYDTCSSSAINGWGAYADLNTYYFSHATAAAKASSVTSLGGDKPYTVAQHFEGMQEGYTNSTRPNATAVLPNNQIGGSEVSTIAVIASALTLATAGVIFVVRKRKEDR